MKWVLIIYLAGYTNGSHSGGAAAVQFATREHCEKAATAIREISNSKGSRYIWHVCMETGA